MAKIWEVYKVCILWEIWVLLVNPNYFKNWIVYKKKIELKSKFISTKFQGIQKKIIFFLINILGTISSTYILSVMMNGKSSTLCIQNCEKNSIDKDHFPLNGKKWHDDIKSKKKIQKIHCF